MILYAYPHLGALAEASQVAAENKARLSFRARMDTLREMELVANELAVRVHLLRLERAVEEFVCTCSREERFLLEYRYFRRKKELVSYGEFAVPWSERTYYRRQSALLKKAAAFFSANGWSEEEFLDVFSDYQPFMRLRRSILSRTGECCRGAQRKTRSCLFCAEAFLCASEILLFARRTFASQQDHGDGRSRRRRQGR